MRTRAIQLVLALMLATGGCSQVFVQSDFDPSANFTALRTYAWFAAEQPKSGDVRVDNPLLDARVRAAVETALNSRGYMKTDANPDFFLIYHAAVSREIEVTTTSTPIYPPALYGWHYVAPPVWVERKVPYVYDKGSLIVDVIDANNEKLMWRGSIQAELDKYATPQERGTRLDAAVKKMMAQFPPEPAKK